MGLPCSIQVCVYFFPLTVLQLQEKLIDFHETWYECHAIGICPKTILSRKIGHPIVFWNEKISVRGLLEKYPTVFFYANT